MFETTLLSTVSRTGNPVVDALLAAFLLSIVTKLTCIGKTHANKLWEKLIQAPEHTLTVVEFDHTGMGNTAYNALRWYLNDKAPVSRGNMTALTTYLYKTVMPQGYQRVPFDFGGQCMSYYITEIQFETDKEGRNCCKMPPSIVLCTKGNPATLKKLLELAESKYSAKRSEWSQYVYVLEDEGSRCRWGARKTDSTKTFDNLVMEPSQKQKLRSDLDKFKTGEEWYKKVGITYKRGYLLYGEPGCGKSSAISVISNYCEYDIYMFNLSVTKTDELFRNAFRQIPSKALVVFEDIDCDTTITHVRKPKKQEIKPGDADRTLTLSAILNELDGVASQHGRIIVMTTNRLEVLDPALIRAGRMDFHLEMGKCSRAVYGEFFALFFPGKGSSKLWAKLPEHVLSPAQVSGLMLKHKDAGVEIAARALSKALDKV